MNDNLVKELQALVGYALLGLLTCFFMVAFALADNTIEYSVISAVFAVGFSWLKASLDSFSKDKEKDN